MLQLNGLYLAHKREGIEDAILVRSSAAYDVIEQFVVNKPVVQHFNLPSQFVTYIYNPQKFHRLAITYYCNQRTGEPISVRCIVLYKCFTEFEVKVIDKFFELIGMSNLFEHTYLTEYEYGILSFCECNYQFSPNARQLPHFLVCNFPTIPFSNVGEKNFHMWFTDVVIDELDYYFVIKPRRMHRGIVFPNHASVGYYEGRTMYVIDTFAPSSNLLYVIPKIKKISVINDTCEWQFV